MKKIKKLVILALACLCVMACALGFAGCDFSFSNGSTSEPTVWTMETVYARAQELGYEGSLEEFRESIRGKDGQDGVDGKDGVGIEKVEYDENGDLKITFTDGSKQTIVIPEKETGEKQGTYGLQYQRILGKDEYRVMGIGIVAELDIVIPDTYNGLPITEISQDAFNVNSSHANAYLTSVTIPDSVTTIGDRAFRNCSSLTSVTIGDSVTSIGNDAFYNCSSLTSVTIGDSVTTIGRYAFYNCSSLTSVTIGDSVTTIGQSAFEDCSSLTSVTIPDSVTTIGYSAFKDCSSLTSVVIPGSVTSIESSAFYNCSRLTSITFTGTYAQWEAIQKGYNWNYGMPAENVVCLGGVAI